MRETVAASAALAMISLFAGAGTGNFSAGLGIAVGFAAGSLNGVLMLELLQHSSPFVMSSVARLALVSAGAILLAFLLGAQPAAVLLGVAAAQVVMVGVAVRRGLRA
jgi:hypothetical protein